MREDIQLLEAWRAGDKRAGNQLVERYFDQIYLFFRNKIDATEVDDLTQRTFLRCVEARDAFRGDAPFRIYLLAIARNELYQHLRRRQRRPDALDFAEISIEAIGTTPSGFAVRRREHALLLQALRRIPVSYQIALELYFWEDCSGPEIAIVLGVPEGTARSWIRRGRLALAKEIEAVRDGGPPLDASDENLAAWAGELREAARAGLVDDLPAAPT